MKDACTKDRRRHYNDTMHDALQPFLPPIARWFEERVGLPTPPQVAGWPRIRAGESVLILAPTGSGKTLAAFLAAIDRLMRDLLDAETSAQESEEPGVRILYLSPLKALANDVEKNLARPLEQIAATARRMPPWRDRWPDLRIAVRTGDTPQKARAAMLRHPPHLLITTPESLNLLLTSAGRHMLRSVRVVIVDEVHALAGSKRGVFLSILLERLEDLRRERAAGKRKVAPGVYLQTPPPPPLARIGLSATARPAEEIARWLGGCEDAGRMRPVAIIDTGQRKRLDVQVLCPWQEEEARSHWPAVARRLLQLIREHRSTLVFANARRLVERLVKMLDEAAAPSGADAPAPAAGQPRAILPHHGSISKNVRLATEEALKRGELSAVVTTSALELGIDIGTLDLVCQVDSPGTVAAALQRVGRAGHLEKATAKGRLIPRLAGDLPALAALVPLMLAGQVEAVRLPDNCLDVLAQQIVAACVGKTWLRRDLLRLMRRAAPYRRLAEDQFNGVLDMLAPPRGISSLDAPLRPRIAFDRVNDQLAGLPASRHLATVNGGVIAETGQYPVYIAQSKVRLGELDEEFVYETREQDRIVLGSQVWTVETIEPDRVTVNPAPPGGSAKMPFWRGEAAPRSPELGAAIASLNDEIERRLAVEGADAAREWLRATHHLDDAAADALLDLFARQRSAGSAMPTATRVVVEHFTDKTGEPLIAMLTPFGARVHQALRLALESALARRRITAQLVHSDDGILLRCAPEGCDQLPGHPLNLLTAGELESLVIDRLEESSLFGLRFRQNAARALLLPRMDPKKRTPLWQQRLRARNLLAMVRRQRNFPIVVETYRECMQDVLMIEQARRLLADIAAGRVRVSVHATHGPSPMARNLWANFEASFIYQWDDPLTGSAGPTVDQGVLDALLQRQTTAELPPAWGSREIALLQRRIRGDEYPARNGEELLEKIAAAGAASLGPPDDPAWRTWTTEDPLPLLMDLQEAHRLVCLEWPSAPPSPDDPPPSGPSWRWLAAETLAPYLAAIGHRPPLFRWRRQSAGFAREPVPYDVFPPALLRFAGTPEDARRLLLQAELRRHVLNTSDALMSAFPFMRRQVADRLDALERAGGLVRPAPGDPALLLPEYADQLRTLAVRHARRGVLTAGLDALQQHLLRWHHLLPASPAIAVSPASANRDAGMAFSMDALEDALDQLSPLAFELSVWECDLLPVRVPGFTPQHLESLCATGRWVWVGYDHALAFVPRHLLAARPAHESATVSSLSADAQAVVEYLRKNGASFTLDLEMGLEEPAGLAQALRQLVGAGVISNDRLESWRTLQQAAQEADKLQAARPVRSTGWPGSAGSSERGRARRGWRRSEAQGLGGRWFILPPVVTPTAPLAVAEEAASHVERLLRRHGFACKELTVPTADGPWRTCYEVLTRMEWAGTVRRGYFIDRIGGAQFALPGIDLPPPLPPLPPHPPSSPSPPSSPVKTAASSEGDVIWVALVDPACLYAQTEEPWTDPEGRPVRLPRVQGSWVAVAAGRPVLAASAYGASLWPLTADQESLARALRAVPALLGRLPRERKHFLDVQRWMDGAEGRGIVGSAAEGILREAGLERVPDGLRLYRRYR